MDDDVPILLFKALNGGIIVVLFALLGEVFTPKRFAGIFAGAPTVALANLTVTLTLADDAEDLADYALGMLVGASAFVVYVLVAGPAIKRFGALPGSTASLLAWFAVALPAYWAVFR